MTVALGMPVVPTAHDPGPRPPVNELVDSFGRVARDLRISITEKCSLRCTYCMPAEGLPALPRDATLTAVEIARLVGIAARDLGVREVRFTGGEPLMRADLEEIIARSAAAAPGVLIAMTTNGLGLTRRAERLVSAGLHRINISLDTVDPQAFAALTRRDRLHDVLAGIQAARDAGLSPVKLNAVMAEETLAGAGDLLAWAVAERLHLRFIEQMPLDADGTWDRSRMVTAADLLAELSGRFTLTPVGRPDPTAPAEEWRVDDGPATVGVIASVTRAFCGDCDRTRLTAEGTVRSCLFGDDETDLRAALRSAADDAVIADLWRGAMWNKQAGHAMGAPSFARPLRSMGAIGG
ncbi:MAG: GTP 3',8-cyclase MoaA [Nocardioides sp.]|nr:GTP 3',8-cyclase MoaA [Nocardioides sp.]